MWAQGALFAHLLVNNWLLELHFYHSDLLYLFVVTTVAPFLCSDLLCFSCVCVPIPPFHRALLLAASAALSAHLLFISLVSPALFLISHQPISSSFVILFLHRILLTWVSLHLCSLLSLVCISVSRSLLHNSALCVCVNLLTVIQFIVIFILFSSYTAADISFHVIVGKFDQIFHWLSLALISETWNIFWIEAKGRDYC